MLPWQMPESIPVRCGYHTLYLLGHVGMPVVVKCNEFVRVASRVLDSRPVSDAVVAALQRGLDYWIEVHVESADSLRRMH